MSTVWYKYGHLWRRGDNDGDDGPLDRGDGTGDVIFNTLTKIIKDNDTSQWALDSFCYCGELLMDRKRWPDEMNTGHEAKNMIGYWIKKCWRKLWRIDKSLYKPQGRMSRDPFVALYACYWHLYLQIDSQQFAAVFFYFHTVKIPIHLYSPATWRWVRTLRKDQQPHYVKRLDYFRAFAVATKFEKMYEDKFYQDTP